MALIASCLWCEYNAYASGITLGRFGGVYGHTNTDGGLALYWNPARLSLLDGVALTIDGTLVSRDASYDRTIRPAPENPYADQPGVQETNVGLATSSTLAILPYMAASGGWELNRIRIGVGLGVHPAYGGTASWDQNPNAPAEFPGGLDGTQRWSGIASKFLIIHYTAAAAVTFSEIGVSLGVGVSYVSGEIETVRARNVNRGEALLDERGVMQEGRIFFLGDDNTIALNLGLSYDNEHITASVHFRQGYNLNIFGDLNQAYGTQPPIRVQAFLDFPTPHVLQSALTFRRGGAEMTVMADYSTWSRMIANRIFVEKDPPDLLLLIPRNLVNTVSFRAMFGWNFSPSFNLTGMIGVDPSAVPEDTIDAALSDAFKIQLGIGLRAPLHPNILLRTSYTQDFFQTVVSTQSIHEPTADGTYRDSRRWFNVSLEGRL